MASPTTRLSRRTVISTAASALALLPLPGAAAGLVATPRQTAGPFYPKVKPLDSDADLVHVAGQGEAAAGIVTDVLGRILGPDGRPAADALVETWQCDAFGHYHHPLDAARRGGEADPRFQGYGRTVSAADGGYRFRTIRPVAYPGRTPHIHFAVTVQGFSLTTQMYVAGEPLNESDFILSRLRDPEQRARVIVPLEPSRSDDGKGLIGVFDIVLGA
jgi:protocatechuate 3,4-dioxygenase beta subunit